MMTVPVQQEFQRCAPWLQAALDHAGRLTLGDVAARLEANTAALWPGERSVMVTEIDDYGPDLREIHVWLGGGDLGELLTFQRERAEDQARGWGCHRATITGRPGWVRALKGHGYRVQSVTLVKDLV